jgi:hypothetical protein
MFGMSIIQQAEVVVILAIALFVAYVLYRLNAFKKE